MAKIFKTIYYNYKMTSFNNNNNHKKMNLLIIKFVEKMNRNKNNQPLLTVKMKMNILQRSFNSVKKIQLKASLMILCRITKIISIILKENVYVLFPANVVNANANTFKEKFREKLTIISLLVTKKIIIIKKLIKRVYIN